jgi:hypothetical protein
MITDVLIVSGIIAAFTIFAVALTWSDYQTRDIARTSRARAAAGANAVPLKRNAALANAAPALAKTEASAA